MSPLVLDSSAVLALLNRETGHERVADALVAGTAIGSVNLAEVVTRLANAGMPEAVIRTALNALDLTVVPFDAELAFRTGLLRPSTREHGLSLGDRACLALGQSRGQPVLTADRAWKRVMLAEPVAIEVIR